MSLDKQWFSEICKDKGTAFSLQIKTRLHAEQTPHQHIEIIETTGFGTLMVIDGFVMLTDFDNFIYHEMLAHPALFNHPNPKNILIIGGGDCGTLREVLKHDSVEKALQVDIDERVTRLAEQYFPQLCTANGDPRAELYFDDGIQWVKQVAVSSYDIIIIDSTDPVGPAEGLFTEAFYRDCHRALSDNGIIVQQSESPLFHVDIINPMRQAMKRAGYHELLTINFPQCCYPSGWWSATMAAKSTLHPTARLDEISNKSFETRYFNRGIHQAAMASPEFLQQALIQ